MTGRTRVSVTPAMSLVALFVAYGLVFFYPRTEVWAWQTDISGTAGGGVFNASVVDGCGNVVAAGATTNTDTGNDFTVVKLDGTSGAELWRQVIPGGGANAVTVDEDGNVVAAGAIRTLATGPSFIVIKFDGVSGEELWRQVIVGDGATGMAAAVVVDGEGDVVAAGRINTPSGSDFTVIKVDGSRGTELWRQAIKGAGHINYATAAAVDGEGNVVAGGTITTFIVPTILHAWTVIKFDGASGAELWRQATDASNDSIFPAAQAVAVDGAANVVAVGITNPGARPTFMVIKYDGVSGFELWRRQIGANPVGGGRAVAVDEDDSVIAAGSTRAGTDFTVVKLDGASGAEVWLHVIPGGAATAVTVDRARDVVATGFTGGAMHQFVVIKVDGANGAELWRQSLVGGEGRAVALDSKRDVIAAGDLNNLATVMKLDRKDGGSPKREPGADGRAARDSERQRCGRAPLRSAEGGP